MDGAVKKWKIMITRAGPTSINFLKKKSEVQVMKDQGGDPKLVIRTGGGFLEINNYIYDKFKWIFD